LLANTYEKEKDFDEAIKHYRKILEDDPDYIPCYERLAAIYLGKNNYKLAKESLEKAVRLSPQGATFHYNLGIVLFKEKNYRKAIDQFNKTIEIDPAFSLAYRGLAVCYEYLGEKNKSKQCYEKYESLIAKQKMEPKP
jgi:Tfp pilus assembly protein PilF